MTTNTSLPPQAPLIPPTVASTPKKFLGMSFRGWIIMTIIGIVVMAVMATIALVAITVGASNNEINRGGGIDASEPNYGSGAQVAPQPQAPQVPLAQAPALPSDLNTDNADVLFSNAGLVFKRAVWNNDVSELGFVFLEGSQAYSLALEEVATDGQNEDNVYESLKYSAEDIVPVAPGVYSLNWHRELSMAGDKAGQQADVITRVNMSVVKTPDGLRIIEITQ